MVSACFGNAHKRNRGSLMHEPWIDTGVLEAERNESGPPSRRERIVTVTVTAIAVLVVAVISVLMGMN